MKTRLTSTFNSLITDCLRNQKFLWENQSTQPKETGLEDLIGSNPTLELMLNIGPCISWIWQVPTGEYSFMSANTASWLGYTSESFLKGGISFTRNLYHPNDAGHVKKLMRQVWAFLLALPTLEREVCQYSCDYRLRKSNGSYLRLLEQSRVLQTDIQGNITQVFGMWTDISHWKKSEILIASINSATTGLCLVSTSADMQIQPQNSISKREQEVIQLIAQGLNSKEIASHLGVSFHTITTHRHNIRQKTNCKNTGELIQYAIQNGII